MNLVRENGKEEEVNWGFQNELQQKYLNMLEDREEAMNKVTTEIKVTTKFR